MSILSNSNSAEDNPLHCPPRNLSSDGDSHCSQIPTSEKDVQGLDVA